RGTTHSFERADKALDLLFSTCHFSIHHGWRLSWIPASFSTVPNVQAVGSNFAPRTLPVDSTNFSDFITCSISQITSRLTPGPASESNIKQEIQHIPVLHHILFPFRAHLAGFLGALLALAGNEVLERDRLRTDEAALEVGVDDAGGLGR